ncbi:MAG: hypothetical protein VR69_00280 [Peptococcaceae bacterium BRH_c4b]|nr:MAG: hypothetical protein VR69_00280 [Peptococcaceae bacterium BRH_c4b]
MIRVRRGLVTAIERKRLGYTEALVQTGEALEKAVSYDALTGPLQLGDEVVLNTTAVHKNLGTGGMHFVMANLSHRELDPPAEGHIMKLRYTPGQVKVLAVEEEQHPLNQLYRGTDTLSGMPVIIGTLHSMLGPAAATLKKYAGEGTRVVYVMTDGAALPLQLSNLVAELKEKGLLQSTVTCGHAFGGDLEAVNVYSGLLAARGVAGADAVIITMGPGIVGTGTSFGFTGTEQGELVNAVNVLGGRALAIPRITFADARERHRGLSHHTRTSLGKIALTSCVVTLPLMDGEKNGLVKEQLEDSGISRLHRTVEIDASATGEILREYGLKVATMGRGYEQDSEFFMAAGAAGIYAANLLNAGRT